MQEVLVRSSEEELTLQMVRMQQNVKDIARESNKEVVGIEQTKE
ncbi:hypothetical protein [Shouchella shacheensis]|nr:hypothetical protein [Shouchella shacheensis]